MSDQIERPHPLDPCDPNQCYQVLMSERTALITARRESEDNLIKTIIQLASALIALMSGFIAQTDVNVSGRSFVLLGAALSFLGIAIVGGLTEHFFASKAYEEQQSLVEKFYQKEIYEFGPAPSNRWVRVAQLTAFISFVFALVSLGAFALAEAGDRDVQRDRFTAPAAPNASIKAVAGQSRPGQVGGPVHAAPASPVPEKVKSGKYDGQERPNSLPEAGRNVGQ